MAFGVVAFFSHSPGLVAMAIGVVAFCCYASDFTGGISTQRTPPASTQREIMPSRMLLQLPSGSSSLEYMSRLVKETFPPRISPSKRSYSHSSSVYMAAFLYLFHFGLKEDIIVIASTAATRLQEADPNKHSASDTSIDSRYVLFHNTREWPIDRTDIIAR